MKISTLESKLDIMIPNPRCELEYNHDYELVIAVMLSAQCTDKRVNIVTKNLFSKYSLEDLASISESNIQKEIKSLGSYTKKAHYLSSIAKRLVNDFNKKVPCDRNYLESLPGVGRKSANVILSELFNIPTIAVDTHVKRVANRLELSKSNNVVKIEKDLEKTFSKEKYNKINHQLLLLGRYTCTSKNPKCDKCLIDCPNKKLR